ncbi:hypothetical protein OG21DRAFT_1489393 [Imleria badia]|nr:hypothetical protein OG21DRAFT_1489393 [Imleria badia]
MAISANCDLATGGGKTISLCSLCDKLPSSYVDHIQDDGPDVQESPIQLAEPKQSAESLRAGEESNSDSEDFEKTVQELRNEQKDTLHGIIRSLRADLHTQETSSNEQALHLEETALQVRHQLPDPQHTANRIEDSVNETVDSLRDILSARDARHKQINQQLRVQLAECQQKADRLIRIIAHTSRNIITAESLIEITNILNEDERADKDKFIFDWLAEFTHQCVATLERVGDEASNAEKRNEAVAAYSAVLSLGPSNPNPVLMKWARMMLIGGSVQEALSVAAKFKLPKVVVYCVICDILEEDGRLTEAIECFQQMQNELPEDTGMQDERTQWKSKFRGRCVLKLEKLGDTARDSKKHDEAIKYYSNALSLGPQNVNDIRLKCGDEIIELDPSSHTGYEAKHAALHNMGRYREAFESFTMMLSKLEQFPDPQIRELRPRYFDATTMIRKAVEQTIRHLPRVLIDTITGRLCDKIQQAAAFEELPIYDELRSGKVLPIRDAVAQVAAQ